MTRKEEITVLSDARFEILQEKCKHIALEDSSPSTTTTEKTRDEPHGRSLGKSEGTDSVIIEADENGAPQNTSESEEAIDMSIFEDPDLNVTMFGTSSGFPLIFVGTKWCGAGDVARSIDDLGTFDDTDKCCREHDHCPDNIPSKECKHDLCNDGDYTRSHCSCDDKFLRCLKDDKGPSKVASFKIAHVYFNLLRPKCFDLRHPTKECKKHRITGECIQHTYDYEQPTTWQYFAAQPYTPVTRALTKILDLDPLNIPTNIGRVVPTLPSSLPTIPSLRFPLDSIGSSRGNTGEN